MPDRLVLKVIITYVLVNIIDAIIGFNYNIIKEILSIKTFIDFGVWVIVYSIVSFIINLYIKKSKKPLDN